MSHVASRWPLVLIAALVSVSYGRAQDPIPVAYWSHQRQSQWAPPGGNAFAPPRAYYAPTGPQMMAGPPGLPESGVQTPFIIPPGAPYGHKQRHSLGGGNGGGPFSFLRFRAPLMNDSLPTHPFARSPRDFFMFHENLEAERSRDLRPTIVP